MANLQIVNLQINIKVTTPKNKIHKKYDNVAITVTSYM